MRDTDTTEPTPPLTPRSRRRLIMTKADWARVEQQVREAERHPDPAQQNLLDEAGA